MHVVRCKLLLNSPDWIETHLTVTTGLLKRAVSFYWECRRLRARLPNSPPHSMSEMQQGKVYGSEHVVSAGASHNTLSFLARMGMRAVLEMNKQLSGLGRYLPT